MFRGWITSKNVLKSNRQREKEREREREREREKGRPGRSWIASIWEAMNVQNLKKKLVFVRSNRLAIGDRKMLKH